MGAGAGAAAASPELFAAFTSGEKTRTTTKSCVRPASMLSLEQGLQKHLALSDLLCAVDDVRYMLAAPPTK